jgi:hypothetical protein
MALMVVVDPMVEQAEVVEVEAEAGAGGAFLEVVDLHQAEAVGRVDVEEHLQADVHQRRHQTTWTLMVCTSFTSIPLRR